MNPNITEQIDLYKYYGNQGQAKNLLLLSQTKTSRIRANGEQKDKSKQKKGEDSI